MPARVQGMQREPGSMRARSPHAFFIYLFYFFCLRRPASRRWTATRSRTLTSRKMLSAFFRIFASQYYFSIASQIFCFVASQILFFCLRRAASRRWSATRSRTLTLRKMLSAFFRSSHSFIFCAKTALPFPPSQKRDADPPEKVSFPIHNRKWPPVRRHTLPKPPGVL